MTIFKCKMCGGSLDVVTGMTVCQCSYCGTSQTLPSVDNEKLRQLFERANYYRMNSEFDKASMVYENIISEAPKEAEAHWGSCLCRYGIEYVEDPKTGQRIPTCHRTQFCSILDDPEYLSALKYADSAAYSVYRDEAVQIDRIQRKILEISSHEEPFDIFICYKETDNAGGRTPDSVIAQDIYESLTDKGYKVFFSRITLEDKIGQEYEPYIFASLNSSQIMLVVGTKSEHFNAVWVKNEWSRFLDLAQQGQKKIVIPCYRDMSPYDLPEELTVLQSQDVSKVGYMQDLLRGIEKILTVGTVSAASSTVGTDSLVDRAFIFLEDKDWQSADEYFEKALDSNPRNARAYLGKLMSELNISYEKDFRNIGKTIGNFGNFTKAMRFADDSFKDKLKELEMLARFGYAESLLKEDRSRSDALKAREIFRELGNFGDAVRYTEIANRKISEIEQNNFRSAKTLIDSPENGGDYIKALKLLEDASGIAETPALIMQCETALDELYNNAIKEMENAKCSADFAKVQKIFEDISGYKNSGSLAFRCLTSVQGLSNYEQESADEERRKAEAAEVEKQILIKAEKNQKREKLRNSRTVLLSVFTAASAAITYYLYNKANGYDYVLASDYVPVTVVSSFILTFLMIYLEVRVKGKSDINKILPQKLAVLLTALEGAYIMTMSYDTLIAGAFMILIHSIAVFLAIKIGKRSYLRYYE